MCFYSKWAERLAVYVDDLILIPKTLDEIQQ